MQNEYKHCYTGVLESYAIVKHTYCLYYRHRLKVWDTGQKYGTQANCTVYIVQIKCHLYCKDVSTADQ